MYCSSHIYVENFKLKLCMRAQSHALGTHTKFQLEIVTIRVISGIVIFLQHYFGELDSHTVARRAELCTLSLNTANPLGWFICQTSGYGFSNCILEKINSLGPGRCSLKVMACCLMAPSNYLNQCRLIITEVLKHTPESNFTGYVQGRYS